MRIKPLILIAAAASAVALTGSAEAGAAATSTPASGAVVVTESNTFLWQAASNGIIAIPLPTASTAYNSTTGAVATFPVTGGAGNIPQFFGNLQLGGGLLLVDGQTGKAVSFHHLAFSIDNYAITGVVDGTTTTVSLIDVGGNATISRIGTTPQTIASDAVVDADGAQYLDTALKTTFFTANQALGSLNVTFTPAS